MSIRQLEPSSGRRAWRSWGDAENARPENDGQRKLWVWKMQEWKMTDKNYGVWKMQDCKMTDKLLANCEHNYVYIFDVYLANYLELD